MRPAAVHDVPITEEPAWPAQPVWFSLPIDGRRLQRSPIGMWVALVVLSWVSLIWGALISLPLGIGFGLFATLIVGFIVVPVWGTVWGLLGMGPASRSTLASMGFVPLHPDHPLTAVTAHYAHVLELPMPRLGTVNAFNAFAMGTDRHDATVAIGIPLLGHLTPQEAAAVIGHELGHVASGDMRRMVLMRTFQNATVWFGMTQGLKQFARWIICWGAEIMILVVSRDREYWADAVGAALAGPDAMIGALRKLEAGPPLSGDESTHARFMIRGRSRSLFSTHPTTAERIAALEQGTFLRALPVRYMRT